MIFKNSIGVSLIAALSTAGCAMVYEGKYDWNDGWREATVLQIGSAAEIEKPQFSDCREIALPQQLSSGKFIVVSYMHTGHRRKRVVPFNSNEGVLVGDLVYMNVLGCDKPLMPRIRPNR